MYDLIVIGNDLSSYVAAALASRYGVNTALITENDWRGSYRSGGFTFNLDPLPMTGFGANQTCLSLLAELDIPTIERTCILLNPSFQVILPQHRIDFFNEIETLVNELIREFPDIEEEIFSFYEAVYKYSAVLDNWFHDHPLIQPRSLKDCYDFLKLIPYYFKHKVSSQKIKKLLEKNESLKRVMECQSAMFSCLAESFNSFPSYFLYGLPLRGVHHFQGGNQIFYNALMKSFLATGGTHLNNCAIKEIDRKKLVKVDLTNSEGNISSHVAKYIIISTKSERIKLLFNGGDNTRSFTDWIRPAKVKYLPFTIHLGIKEKCLPEKIARHVAVIGDEHKNIYDDNMIILETSAPEDEVMAPAGKIALTATVFLPAEPEVWREENLQTKASSLLDRLEFFLPFLKENIEMMDINKSIAVSIKQKEVLCAKYQIRNSFISGFTATTNKTRYGNIYVAGGSLFSDAGFEGEILSGINAASCVISKVKL